MLDGKILDRARRLIEAQFAKRQRVLIDEVNRIMRKMQIAGMAHSGLECKCVRAACEEEVRVKAEIVLDSIKKAHKAHGSPLTKTLATDLKEEVSFHIEKIVKEVSELMYRRLNSMKPSTRLLDFESTKREVNERIYVEVELYVDSLEQKPAETGRGSSAGKGGGIWTWVKAGVIGGLIIILKRLVDWFIGYLLPK